VFSEGARCTEWPGGQKELLPKTKEKQLRRILYGMYILLKLHFNKEEEISLLLLETDLSLREGRLCSP
jgi:hypothetical protein